MLVLRAMGIGKEAPDDDERLRKLKKPDDLRELVRKKTKELLIDEELRKRR